jgi:hypothetical protein
MRCRPFILFGFSLLFAFSGCQGTAKPKFLSWPGPTWFQRQRAQRFDPYPEAELDQIAPGNGVDGTRPRDFQRPSNETKRIQSSPYVAPRFPANSDQ